MRNLYKYIDLKTWFLTILHSITFFMKILFYRKLYVITSSINSDTDLSEFYKNTVYIISVVIFIEIMNYVTYYYVKKQLTVLISDIFSSALTHLLKYKINHLELYDKSKLATIYDTIYPFETVFEKFVINLPRSIIYMIYYIYGIYEFSLNIVVVMLVISIVTTFFLHKLTIIKENNYNKIYDHETLMKQKHSERFNNIKYIKANQTENLEQAKIFESYEKKCELRNFDSIISNVISVIPDLMGNILTCFIYMIGALQVKLLIIKPIELIFLGSNSNNFIQNVTNLKSILDDYKKHYEQMNIIFDFYEDKSKIEESSHELYSSERYERLKIIHEQKIKSKEIILEFGKITSIVGKNGCGKTTMIYSLLGLASVDDLNEFKLSGCVNDKWYNINFMTARKMMSFIFQDAYMFDMSLVDNIIYGISSYTTNEHIEQIVQKMNLTDWYNQNSYRKIDVNGDKISGGEKKKVQLINALLHNKNIIIFDEPTNNLDDATKLWYLKQIKQMASDGKMIIIITHDENIICQSDLVVDMEMFRNM